MSKIGRNDPCPCGSGKKYKQCCAKNAAASAVPSAPVTIAALFGDALAHHQAGRFTEAEALYRKIIETEPKQPDVLHLLGVIAYQTRRHETAVQLITEAIEIERRNPMYYSNLGNALQELGKFDAAVVNYRQAIDLKPDYAQAHNNLGNALQALGAFDAAQLSYKQALTHQPDYVEAYQNLGRALLELGRFDEALAGLRQAVVYRPDDAELHNQLGRVLTSLGETAAAIEHFQRAVALQPAHAEAHNNLGHTLRDSGASALAISHFQQALQLKPHYALAHLNLGNALVQQGHTDAAIARYRQILTFQPDYADAHNNLGQALASQGALPAAYEHFRTALQFKPDFDVAHSNLLFHLNYQAGLAPEHYLQEARVFGERVQLGARPYVSWPADQNESAGRKLRIGFVSGDLRTHPVSFFLESVVAHLDPERFELVAYVTKPGEDAVTARIKRYFAQWHTLFGISDEAAARKIHDDGVHILIDLAGHTADNRLPVFAWKPAPVQVAWLGYFASTGLAAIDYILADWQVLPASEESHFVEKPWRLPDCYLCFTAPQDRIDVGVLPMLSRGYVTFGCFNKLSKMNDAVVALWARVLHAVPGSRLLLKSKELNDAAARATTLARFAVHGLGGDRIELDGYSPRTAYLTDYGRVDIALDPFPFPGGTTTVEALWMGVPVLSRRGRRFLSHAGESLLKTAGLPDWLADDDDDYVAKAQAYAADAVWLADLRAKLRAQLLASPLCDAPLFTEHLGQALTGMWQGHLLEIGKLAHE